MIGAQMYAQRSDRHSGLLNYTDVLQMRIARAETFEAHTEVRPTTLGPVRKADEIAATDLVSGPPRWQVIRAFVAPREDDRDTLRVPSPRGRSSRRLWLYSRESVCVDFLDVRRSVADPQAS
jgi:hypothetical protein